jgi:hypothetical protein
MTDEPIMLSDIQRLVVNPGDTVVLKSDMHITVEQADALKQRIRLTLGDDIKVMVLGGGLDIGVIAQS